MMNDDENIYIGKLLKQFLFFWKVYIPIGIVCLTGAILFVVLTPKQYKISSTLQLLEEKTGMMSELKMLKSSALGGLLSGGSVGVNTNDQILIMSTRENMGEVINKNRLQLQVTQQDKWMAKPINLDELPFAIDFNRDFLIDLERPIILKIHTFSNGEISISVKSKLFETVQVKKCELPFELQLKCGEISFYSLGAFSNATYKIKIIPLQLYYEDLMEEITIKPSESISDIVELSIESDNIDAAKSLLNGIMQQYIAYSRSKKNEEISLNTTFVKQKLDTITAELAYLEYQIEKYKQKGGIPDFATYGEVVYLGNKEAEKLILELETKKRMLDYIISYMQNGESKFNAIPIVEELGDKSVLIFNQLILDRQRLLQTSEKGNPALQLIEKQISEQYEMLLETILSLRNNLQIALDAAYKKEEILSKKVNLLPKQEREFIEMKRQQMIKESIYLFLMQKLQENALVNSPDEKIGRVIDVAYPSYKHVFPKVSIVLLIAFITTCMLSLIICFIKVTLSNKKQ